MYYIFLVILDPKVVEGVLSVPCACVSWQLLTQNVATASRWATLPREYHA